MASDAGPMEVEAGRKRKRSRSEICKDSRELIQKHKKSLRSLGAKLEATTAKQKEKNASLEKTENLQSLELEHLNEKIIPIEHRNVELKKEVDDQKKQLEEFSKHSLFGQDEYQIHSVEMWGNTLIVWRQTDWDNWSLEKAELEKEISELEKKNFKLKMKKRILYEKIIHCQEQGNP